MSVIIYNAVKIKSFENLKALCAMAGETEEFAMKLWQNMLEDEELLEEFNYYVTHQTLKGTVKCGELTLIDVYFSQMSKYNLFHDMGKNPDYCNKDRMILHAFSQMVEMRKDPEYMVHFEDKEESGMDKM